MFFSLLLLVDYRLWESVEQGVASEGENCPSNYFGLPLGEYC